MASLSYDTEAEWKSIRAKHVGSSEVGALFGLSPWLTKWQLFMLKTGKLPDVFESSVMTQGRHFEPAVASYAKEKFEIELRKVRRYLSSDETPGLGASLDYEEIGSGSLIPTELKFSLWGDGWEYEGSELTAIPDSYMMQVQTQLACMPSAPHAQLIAFTGGDLKRMIIPRSERLITAIREAVTAFWGDVREGREPPVDFTADADAVTRLAYLSKLRTLTMTPDREHLFAAWDEHKREAATHAEAADAARAEILKAVIDAGEGNDEGVKVVCGTWKASVSKVAENLGKEITAADIGTRVGARKGHLRAALVNTAEKK